MPAFRKQDEYEPEPIQPAPLTENCRLLLDLNAARAEAAADVADKQSRMSKLAKLKELVAALEIELSQLLAARRKAAFRLGDER